MKLRFDPAWLHSPTAQLALVGLLALGAVGAVAWQKKSRGTMVEAPKGRPAALPQTLARDVAKFVPRPPAEPAGPVAAKSVAPQTLPPPKPPVPPLALYAAAPAVATEPTIPYGRMIACETVVTVESDRTGTPLIGLVSEDFWHGGRLIVPAGAEVHGRARIDRERECLVADGTWTLCWQQPRAGQIRVEGIALTRDSDPIRDGAAGLPGRAIRTDRTRELKLFTATFLSAATTALQEQRGTAGLIGEAFVPTATARNAALAGTAAVLRDYARQVGESIARDDFHVRVSAGEPFTLYVTQPLALTATHEK